MFHKVWSTGCCVTVVVGVDFFFFFFNVKIKKRKKKETKNTMALETEALSISSVLKMIKITNQNLDLFIQLLLNLSQCQN